MDQSFNYDFDYGAIHHGSDAEHGHEALTDFGHDHILSGNEHDGHVGETGEHAEAHSEQAEINVLSPRVDNDLLQSDHRSDDDTFGSLDGGLGATFASSGGIVHAGSQIANVVNETVKNVPVSEIVQAVIRAK